MISRFYHHLLCRQKVVIQFAGHLSETFFYHHFLITMGPCLTLHTVPALPKDETQLDSWGASAPQTSH